jgi:predicted nucleic acid-binding protein
MVHGILVDAGPMVAILNRRDRDHEACVNVLKKLRRPLLSTWMPVTEAMYLLDFSVAAQGALLEMIERGALRILEIGNQDLPGIRSLMKKYGDQPMDFADATLVHVAQREALYEVFTLDQRDFGVYRLKQGKSFTVFPSQD